VTPIADVQLERAIDEIKGIKLWKQMNVAERNTRDTTVSASATPSTP